jgi:hypothetical protein
VTVGCCDSSAHTSSAGSLPLDATATQAIKGSASLFLLLAIFCFILTDVPPARAEEVPVIGGVIDMQFTTRPSGPLVRAARKWVEDSARAVTTYYGSFPVGRCVLRISLREGRKPRGGQAFGWNGALITIFLGRDAAPSDLSDDWLLPHEMLHLGFPNLAERHQWLEEGLATYIEPIARARAGLLTPALAWSDLANGLHQGQPEAGDQGLDRTHTWGRTYWGGALFCLLADVEIRRRSGNSLGLENAVRAVVAAGGTIETWWDIDRVIATGDTAVGAPVLRELYDQMKETPVTVDLQALWKKLGVVHRGRKVTFDDSAPLASIRKAITGG